MKQTTLSGVGISAEATPDGGRILLIQINVDIPVGPDRAIQVPTEVIAVPMPQEVADGLAKDLKGSDLVTAPASALRALPKAA